MMKGGVGWGGHGLVLLEERRVKRVKLGIKMRARFGKVSGVTAGGWARGGGGGGGDELHFTFLIFRLPTSTHP